MPQKQPPFLQQTWNLIRNPDRSLKAKVVTLRNLSVIFLRKIRRLRIMLKPKPPGFSGWGMTSDKFVPWNPKSSDDTGLEFSEVTRRLLAGLNADDIIFGGGYELDGYENLLKRLSWRHYVVYWTSKFSAKNTQTEKVNIVETGVWYGMSTQYAIAALQSTLGKSSNFEVFLYDAWEGMKEENLTSSEKSSKGNYSYLSVEQTKSNLSDFQDRCKFIKGHIPEVFFENPGPTELSWLHIDLNSSMPTLKTLEQFVPKLLPGGVVLFDDYAHGGFRETREVADEYCSKVNGLLFPLPTGQAIFFKH